MNGTEVAPSHQPATDSRLSSALTTRVTLSLSGAVIRIVAISGSLRQRSSNTELLRAFAHLAAPVADVRLDPALGELPPFNPDLENREPASVLEFRARLRAADAVVISSPEYAHGIVGSLKNALDWTVGSGEFSGKPVAVFNASPRASLAHESLIEIVRTMDARVIDAAALSLPLLGKNLDAAGLVADPTLSARILQSVEAVCRAVAEQGRL